MCFLHNPWSQLVGTILGLSFCHFGVNAGSCSWRLVALCQAEMPWREHGSPFTTAPPPLFLARLVWSEWCRGEDGRGDVPIIPLLASCPVSGFRFCW